MTAHVTPAEIEPRPERDLGRPAAVPTPAGRARAALAGLAARPGLVVALLGTLLALLLTMPLALHPTTYIYGYPGDSTGAISVFWWWGYALTHGKDLLDNPLQGAPLGSVVLNPCWRFE